MFTLPVDDGTFSASGLDVQIDRGAGSGDTVAKVASGAYDMGLADFYSVLRFNNENPDNKLITVMLTDDQSILSVATLKKNGIETPADLIGKTMAAPVGDASRQLFPLFASANNLAESDINWVNASTELRETLLVRGDADAVVGHITTVTMALQGVGVDKSEIHLMPYSDYGVELLGSAIVVRPEFAQANAEAVTAFLSGAAHGFRRMIADPDAAISSIKKRDPMIDEQIERDRLAMSIEYRFITPHVRENGISAVSADRVQRAIDAVIEPFELGTPPKAGEIYDDTYLPPREELRLD